MTLHFPSTILEENLPRVLEQLGELDANSDPLEIDLSRAKFWIPSAIVAICSMVRKWCENGREVSFPNCEQCAVTGYLQRIDFFEQIGLKLPEAFQRHDPGTSFVVIDRIDPGQARLNEPLARKLASCLAGTNDAIADAFRFSEFAMGELVANCQQHAMTPGYVSAQYIGQRDWARIGIADSGVGIRESFRLSESPFFRNGMSDAEALEMAMKPWCSSKKHQKGPYGAPANRGIGLKMVWNMLHQAGGELFIASGNAWRHYKGERVNHGEMGARFQGTVVSVRFERGQIDDYLEIWKEASRAVNLTPEEDSTILFS